MTSYMNDKGEFIFKICITGDWGVGKTSLVKRWLENTFSEEPSETEGIDISYKVIRVGNHPVKVKLCDTAGQERFKAITNSFYRSAMGVILVYDVTDSESYANLVHWLEECERYADNVDNSVNKAVFANKCDISESDRTIDSKRGQEFAKQNNLTFFETSAKTGAGVDEAFTSFVTAITERVLQKFHRDDDDDAPKKKKKKNIKLGKDTKDKDKEKKKCGCN